MKTRLRFHEINGIFYSQFLIFGDYLGSYEIVPADDLDSIYELQVRNIHSYVNCIRVSCDDEFEVYHLSYNTTLAKAKRAAHIDWETRELLKEPNK